MSKQTEHDRLQALRDAQIKARDPGPSKIRGYDWEQHAQRSKAIRDKRKKEQKPLLVDLFHLLPGRWKGMIYGGLMGLIPLIGAYLLLPAPWNLFGAVGWIICGVVGFVLGATMQNDDE